MLTEAFQGFLLKKKIKSIKWNLGISKSLRGWFCCSVRKTIKFYDCGLDYHYPVQIIVMVFVNTKHSYYSTHDFLSSVEIIVFVNENHSFNSGDDFHTHHQITRMIKSWLAIILWWYSDQITLCCVMIHSGRPIITWIITNDSIAWIPVLGAMRLLGYLSFHCQHTHVE